MAKPLLPIGQVLVSGLLGQMACVLVGVAVGAMGSPPVLRRPSTGVLTTGLLVVVALVASASAASAALRVVASGSSGTAVGMPLPELGGAAAVAVLTGGLSALVARRRGVD